MRPFKFIAERALDKAMVDTGAKHARRYRNGSKTGEILAMAIGQATILTTTIKR